MLNNNQVAHLTSAHPTFEIRIFHKQCKTLSRNGWDVTLIAPGDEDQLVDGIDIKAITDEPSRYLRFIRSPWHVLKRALASKARICHFHDPELVPIGMILRLAGRKVVYDVHEHFPRQIMSKPWIKPWLRSLVAGSFGFMEWVGSRVFFTGVVSATPFIAERFPPQKSVLVQNFPILGELVAEAAVPYEKRPPEFAYIGGIDEIRGSKEMVDAIGLAKNKDARLLIAGEFPGDDSKSRCAAREGWKRVEHRGWQARPDVALLLGSVRAGLVLFHPLPNHVDAQPNKMFEYMSAGLPVIASDFPLWREIVTDAECGLLVDPMKPEQIAEAMDWILENPDEAQRMGENGRKASQTTYTWSAEADKLVRFYEGLK